MSADSFVQVQREHHERADADHFRWQTQSPWFAATEAALVDGVHAGPGERLLEIGCGEGGNLHHLRERCANATVFGVDFSAARAAFARSATGAITATADAGRLPFASASFDAVLIRDLLHHLPDRRRALTEAHRVLTARGRLTLVEPNRRAPLVLLQATLVKAERGLFASSAEQLRGELLATGFRIEREESLQPFPVARVVLNPKLGGERLGNLSPVQRALDVFDELARHMVPRRAWLYLRFEAVKA